MDTENVSSPHIKRDPEAVALGQRIRWARGQVIRRDMAAKVGIHENTFGKWELGDTVPTVLQLARIATATGKDLRELLGLEGAVEGGPMASDAGVELSRRAIQNGAALYIPLVDLRSKLAGQDIPPLEAVGEMRRFSVSQIRQELGIEHYNLMVALAPANSGEPVNAGDVVLVDLTDRDVRSEGLHLVRVDGANLIKHVQRHPGRLVVSNRINSPNHLFVVGLDELGRGQDFEVLGRIRWAGINLN